MVWTYDFVYEIPMCIHWMGAPVSFAMNGTVLCAFKIVVPFDLVYEILKASEQYFNCGTASYVIYVVLTFEFLN